MSVEIEEQDGIHTIRPLLRTMQINEYEELKNTIHGRKDKEPRAVILDLSEVTMVDSFGMGVMISGRMSLRGVCELHLCGLNKRVEEVLRHAKLDLVFPIHESWDVAMKAVKENPDES